MNSECKMRPLWLVVSLGVAFVSLGCENANTVGTDKERPVDIVWQQTSLDSSRIIALAAKSGGRVFAATCGQPIYHSRNLGTSWNPVSPDMCPNSMAINSNGEVFVTSGTQLLRSGDNGPSWVSLDLPFGSLNLDPIAFNSMGNIFVGSIRSDETVGGIYRSDDNGDTWIQTGFPDTLDVVGGAYEIAINSKDHIFAANGVGLLHSTDGGETWSQLNAGFTLLTPPFFITDIAHHPINDDILVAVEGHGVYRSTDGGDTWAQTGLTNPVIQDIVFNSNGDAFAASGSQFSDIEPEGIFFSIDNGRKWERANQGLTNLNVLALGIDSLDFLFAATDGSGVFRSEQATTK